MPQNNWAPIAISNSSFAPVRPMASCQIWAGAAGPAAAASRYLGSPILP